MPTKTALRRDATENREALLAAARVELNRDLSASLETIATSAGLSRRAVYGHFANRDELVRELVISGGERVARALVDVHDADPVVELALVAATLWHETEHVRVMSLFAVRGPFVGLITGALAPLRERVRSLIAQGQKAGAVRADIAPALLARLVEEGALSVLDESSTSTLSSADGHDLAVRVVLSLLGLGWRESNDLISRTPALRSERHA